ncbi:hypothetical protein Plec18170_001554 [Paecilomyces lecythidis]
MKLHRSQIDSSKPNSAIQQERQESIGEAPNLSTLPEQDSTLDVHNFCVPEFLTHDISVDNEQVFEWLMPQLYNESAFSLPLLDFSTLQTIDNIERTSESGGRSEEVGKAAVHEISNIVANTCRNVNFEIQSTGITTEFLNSCLHAFFEQVTPCFPVIHEPTFQMRESVPPLLLNIFALGSLFVSLPGALQKGEVLWRLAHTAVATSWQSLIGRRATHDRCDGVQLVLTALLGQTYALLSRNLAIRKTAFVFHGLGFYWARTSGMYSVESFKADEVPSIMDPEDEKWNKWRAWAASETQRRAILGHYILDGLIAQASGSPASARHVINSIGSTYSDAAFSAKSVNKWILEMQRSSDVNIPMSATFVAVLSSNYLSAPLKLPKFTISVILEGLQSLVSDIHEVNTPVVGTVSSREVISGLINLHDGNLSSSESSAADDRFQLLLRWHSICLELATSSDHLYRAICTTYDLPEITGCISNNHDLSRIDFRHWGKSSAGLRALMHAMAIRRLLGEVPLACAHAPHLPFAIFSSAIIISGMCLAQNCIMEIPQGFTWREAWAPVLNGEMSLSPTSSNATFTEDDSLESLLGKSSGPLVKVNLPSEINFLQLSLKTIISRWTLSSLMDEIIGHLRLFIETK